MGDLRWIETSLDVADEQLTETTYLTAIGQISIQETL
jgi:hypothetical protein